jgi:hypothetical protein
LSACRWRKIYLGRRTPKRQQVEKFLNSILSLQSHGFQETEHHGYQLTAPVASRSSAYFAMDDHWSQCPFRVIIIWFHFWMGEKSKPIWPMLSEAIG